MRSDLTVAFQDAWKGVASPGAVWTGRERVEIAAEARRARSNGHAGPDIDPLVAEAASTVAASPASIRRRWVERVVGEGLGHPGYVELLGIVARVVAVDTFHQCLGMDLMALPEPIAGRPTGITDGRARAGKAWVPMVGGASITQALSLVPFENAELELLHGPLYLTFEQMSDPGFTRGLTRPQMELLAARTSAINECFY